MLHLCFISEDLKTNCLNIKVTSSVPTCIGTAESIRLSADTIFSSFSASFLIEAVGRGELGGALIVPAGWQRWAIQPLYEPSFHQSGKMLNPSEHPHTALAPYLYPFNTTSIPSVKPVVVFLSHLCSNLHQILLSAWHVVVVDGVGVKTAVFWPHAHSRFSSLSHPLLKLAQTQSHSMLSLLLQWITRGLCLGAKILSLSFGDLIRKVVCRGIHHYADGSSFPSHAPSLWMGND